jgi:hypothetical protein
MLSLRRTLVLVNGEWAMVNKKYYQSYWPFTIDDSRSERTSE